MAATSGKPGGIRAAVDKKDNQVKRFRLTFARYGACAVAWDGRVFVFGGNGKAGMLGMRPFDLHSMDNVEVIEPGAKTVAPLLWMLSARRYHGAAAVNGYAYIVGGNTLDGSGATLERVDLRTCKVEQRRSMPTPRFYAAVVESGGLIWVVGGRGRDGFTGALEVYDPKRDTWETAPPMPTGRDSTAAVHNGLIHVPGGFAGQDGLRVYEAYSIREAKWIKQPDLPFPLSAHHVAVVGDTLYSFGDYVEGGKVAACDLRSGKWHTPRLSEPFVPRRNNAVVAVGNTVVVIGGNTASSSATAVDTVQVFRLLR